MRIVLKGESFKWRILDRILDRILAHADLELGTRKREVPDRVPKFGRKVRKLNPW